MNIMKQEIINCLTWYANKVAETVAYDSWSNEYCRGEIREANKIFVNEIQKDIDFYKLTRKEAIELRFGKWDDETDLYLIPLYLLPVIPIGIRLTSINGDTVIYDGTNIDNDIRFGCLAWGINIPEEKGENDGGNC